MRIFGNARENSTNKDKHEERLENEMWKYKNGSRLSFVKCDVGSGSEDVCHLVRVVVREDGTRFSGLRPLLFTLHRFATSSTICGSAQFQSPHSFILLFE